MPVDVNGNITRPPSPVPVSGQDADAPQVNVPVDDIYNIMNMMPFLDGRKPLRGNIPMNGYRATGAGNAVNDQDYVTLAQLQSALSSLTIIPVGILAPLTGMAVPNGWVRANGQSLLRTSFPALWAFVQASSNLASSEAAKTHGQYGPGDGSTTFTVPNLEADNGYFIRPVSSGRGIGTVQADDNRSHTHSGTANTAGGHRHYFGAQFIGSGTGSTGGYVKTSGAEAFTTLDGEHSHTLAINSTGGTESRPKNIAYPVIIKA